jgi:hypothetical protein
MLRTMDQRVQDLCSGLKSYVTRFDEEQLFTGPSIYFHRRTIGLLHLQRFPSDAIRNKEFLESLYATLATWGMHRMGPKGAKLSDFESFKAGFVRQHDKIQKLETAKLAEVGTNEIKELTASLWEIISDLRVSTTQTQIVAGSKALHHVLPELVPPIDREYTVQFFFGYKRAYLSLGEFVRIFSNFHTVAVQCRDEISGLVGSISGTNGMDTSSTKVIDNAIVGYALCHPRKVQLPKTLK